MPLLAIVVVSAALKFSYSVTFHQSSGVGRREPVEMWRFRRLYSADRPFYAQISQITLARTGLHLGAITYGTGKCARQEVLRLHWLSLFAVYCSQNIKKVIKSRHINYMFISWPPLHYISAFEQFRKEQMNWYVTGLEDKNNTCPLKKPEPHPEVNKS